jgi:hypothetical protein
MCTFLQSLILVGRDFKRCSELVPHKDKLCLRGPVAKYMYRDVL